MNGNDKNIFMTGVSGFLGRNLVRTLLRRDPNIVIRALTREGSRHKLKELFLADYGERVIPVTGDIKEGRLGMSEQSYDYERRIADEIIHCAATTDFYAGNDTERLEMAATNIGGTREILDFAAAASKDPVIDYIGTAYISGKNDGRILEDVLPHRNGFRNDYEESKWEAEKLVRDAQESIPGFRIYRPSIILGNSDTYNSQGETRMMYGYLAAIAASLRRGLRAKGKPTLTDVLQSDEPFDLRELDLRGLRLIGFPDTRKDFICIDDVVNSIDAVRQYGHVNHTYNLTNSNNITGRDIGPAIERALNVEGISYVGEEIMDPHKIEADIAEYTQPFDEYTLNSDPTWDNANTEAAVRAAGYHRVHMSTELFTDLLVHYIQNYYLGDMRKNHTERYDLGGGRI